MSLRSDRRTLLIGGAAGLIGMAAAADAAAPLDLFQSADRTRVLEAARDLIEADRLGTLITVDAVGRPRARTVFLAPPDDDLTFWIGTRRGSRKLSQIAANPLATLHLSADEAGGYLSLMGSARRIDDPQLRETKSAYSDDGPRRQFFPNYPDDFELIRFSPEWLEVSNQELPGKKETWQPEALVLKG